MRANANHGDDDPEHNAIQAMFLDDGLCLRLFKLLDDGFEQKIKDGMNERRRGLNPLNFSRDLEAALDIPVTKIELKFTRFFSSHGVSVELWARATSPDHPVELHKDLNSGEFYDSPNSGSEHRFNGYYRIEIKPTVGDDYPAALRQMGRNRGKVLFLKTYTGRGVNREQFIEMFEASGFRVVFLEQCV